MTWPYTPPTPPQFQQLTGPIDPVLKKFQFKTNNWKRKRHTLVKRAKLNGKWLRKPLFLKRELLELFDTREFDLPKLWHGQVEYREHKTIHETTQKYNKKSIAWLDKVREEDNVDINEQLYTCQWMDLDDRSKEPFRNQPSLFRTTEQQRNDRSVRVTQWPFSIRYFRSSVKGPESNSD